MSLPEWMCSDCPLCPLMVRTRGLIEEAEPVLLKCYPSSASVGSKFLGGNCTMECSVFLSCPEVMAALLFVELLGDNEALTVDGLLPLDPRPQASREPVFGPSECSVCLLDLKDHSSNPVKQFEDVSLLRELNKCLVAFRQALNQRRPSPLGRSSSSSAAGQDPACFHSLSSSKTSSSCSSLQAADSPQDPQKADSVHERFVDCKTVPVDRSRKKTPANSNVTSQARGTQSTKPESQTASIASVLGALRKKTTAAETAQPVPQQATPAKCNEPRRLFKVLSSRSPSPTTHNLDITGPLKTTDMKSKAPDSSIQPQTAVVEAGNIARPLASKPPPPATRKNRRSFGESSSRGSLEKNRSLEKILNSIPSRQSSPSTSSAPLLTQAVLCAQRHPSPRPERRGSGSQGAMVFRPVNISPLLARKSAFRPATEMILNQRRYSAGVAAIALPHCEFGALRNASYEERGRRNVSAAKVLASPPVSSPRVQLSVESSLDDDALRRQESAEHDAAEIALPPAPVQPVTETEVWTLARQPSSIEGASKPCHKRTASGSSTTPYGSPTAHLPLPRLPSQKSCDDVYHTADESLEDSPDGQHGVSSDVRPRCLKSRRERSLRSQTSGGGSSAFSSVSRHLSRDDSASSAGFVLDYRSDDDDYLISSLSKHERYEDFRRRIRRRGRRLARRLSRSLRASYSSGSSDMDDIDEDPELGFSRPQAPVGSIRAANSEPTLHVLLPTKGSARELPPLSIASELVMTSSPGRRQTLVMTTGMGRPKAYSFDGVNPNLPVPFKARFRCKKTSEDKSKADSISVGLTRQDTEFIKAHSFRPVSPDLSAGTSEDEIAESAESDIEGEPPDVATADSEDGRRESFVSLEEEPLEDTVPSSSAESFPLRVSASGVRPVATCRWARGCLDSSGDAQLEALVQWIAASVAGVPCLVVYTGGQPGLEQLSQVSFKVEERQWTVGDLACETLRFCRNRVALHEGRNKATVRPGITLFAQLLGQTAVAPSNINPISSSRSSSTCDGKATLLSHDSLE
ncbi:uncharacterized protein LOC144169039 isoform X2 [Haemaphysalis longicornis]